jgi:hypothetical protein
MISSIIKLKLLILSMIIFISFENIQADLYNGKRLIYNTYINLIMIDNKYV